MLNVIMDINIKRIHAIVERDNLSVIANFRLYHPLTIWAIETILMVLHLFTHAARSRPWLSVGEVERARIAVRRQQCITKGNRTPHLDYSGIGCRGVVYD